MKKLLTSVFLLFISLQLAFAEPDMNSLIQINKMVAEKQYEKALDAYRNFFKESKSQSGFGGLRLSYCLSSWAALGKIYPPAMNELILMSNERKNMLLSGNGNSETFQEYKAINQFIEKDNETLATFITLDKDFPNQADSYHLYAKDLLINAKQYDLARKYIDPIYEFESMRFSREADLYFSRKRKGNMVNEQTDATFDKRVNELIDLSNQMEMKEVAAEIKRRYASYIFLNPLKK